MRSLLYRQQYDQEGRLSGGSLHMRLQRSNQLFPVLAGGYQVRWPPASSCGSAAWEGGESAGGQQMRQRDRGGKGERR